VTTAAEKTVIRLPQHLSHSQCSSLQFCSWRYVLEKGLHVPQQPSWATVGGSGIHYATEVWDNWTLNGVWETDRGQIEKLFHDQFDKAIAEREQQEPDFPKESWRASGRASKAWPNKEDESWWRAEGPAMVMSWVTWRTNNSQWEIAMFGDQPGIELECNPVIGGQPVKQFIDRAFTNPEQTDILLVDIKSGRAPDSQQQIGSYGLGLLETFGVEARWGSYWLARTGGTTAFEDMRLWPRERLDDIYRKAQLQRELGLFLPKESNMCSGCSVKDACFAVGGVNSDLYPTPWQIEVEIKSPPVSAETV
jgi:hypothetical protein